MSSANERRRCNIMSSLFDWYHTCYTQGNLGACWKFPQLHWKYTWYEFGSESRLRNSACMWSWRVWGVLWVTVYPKKYAHGFVVLCFVVVMQSFIMNSYEVFIHIHQGCFAGTGAIVRLPQCRWSKPDGYGKISQCITTTKHSKAKTVCIFLGIYCNDVLVFLGFKLTLVVDRWNK